MSISAYNKGAKQYASVQTTSDFGDENPHRLIQMLMEGFLARVNLAKGAMQHGDMEAKSVYISKAIGIVGGLNEVLDMEQGGDLAVNLRQLYDYMNLRLLEASRENNEEILNEVVSLMKDIKEAWDAIG